MSRTDPRTIPAHYLRLMSAADRATVATLGKTPLPQVAPDAPTRPRPDGWRARMNAAPPKLPQSEHALQSELVTWSLAEVAAGRLLALSYLFAIPNAGAGGSRGQAGKMAAEGVKSGVPDLCLPVPRAGFCGAWIEMKVAPNCPSDNQAAWLTALEGIGHRCAVCYTLEEAKFFLRSYLGESLTLTPEQ